MAKRKTDSGAKDPANTISRSPRRREDSEANCPVNTTASPPQLPADTTTSSGAMDRAITNGRSPRRRKVSEAKEALNTTAVPPQPPAELSPQDHIALELAELQNQRKLCIMGQSRCDRSIESAIAQRLGFNVGAKEEERKAVYKAAGNLRHAVELGRDPLDLLALDDARRNRIEQFIPYIRMSAQSRAVWDAQRVIVESAMREVVRSLPVFAFVKEHAKGVGDLGLARIIGEAPLIGLLVTHERLWKRMGVAVIGDERQQRKTDTMEGLLHGYAPARRAELWSVCSDTMFRQQWRNTGNDPDGEYSTGVPVGPYGAVYGARKAYTLPRIAETAELDPKDRRKWTRKRCDNDARRVMSKEFLRDLWRVWHGMEARHPVRWLSRDAA